MLAVSVSVGQSRLWRDESKTIGMCVKGGGILLAKNRSEIA